MSTSTKADIVLHKSPYTQYPGDEQFAVAASATLIYPGDIVTKALGTGTVVALMATNKPVVATDFLAGIATSTSTNTAAAAGTVNVLPMLMGLVYRGFANDSTAVNTQAKYDALVGKRVLLDLTTSVYTVLVADGSTSGCVIEPLDISKFPGQIAFKLRSGLSYAY